MVVVKIIFNFFSKIWHLANIDQNSFHFLNLAYMLNLSNFGFKASLFIANFLSPTLDCIVKTLDCFVETLYCIVETLDCIVETLDCIVETLDCIVETFKSGSPIQTL